MQVTRPRRIVRRAVMTLSVAVLLVPVWYVSGLTAVCFATGIGWIPSQHVPQVMSVAYTPLKWYIDTELPGALLVGRMAKESHRLGRSLR